MGGKENIWVHLILRTRCLRRVIMLSNVASFLILPVSQNWPICRHSLDFPHWWMSCLGVDNNGKTCQQSVNSFSWHSQLTLNRRRMRVSVTFEQQRHEGDVRRTEFGHSQSVGPVVAWGILKGAENQQSTDTALESFRGINETYWNESTRCNLPSASHKHSKFFLSCWGFSAIDNTHAVV